jgi:hypothetical protein
VGNPSGQLADNFLQRRCVKDAGGFAQRTQRGTRHAEFLADLVQPAGLLDATQTGEYRVEEVQQQQRRVLVEEQLAIAGRVPLGADIVQPFQQRVEELEVLKPL